MLEDQHPRPIRFWPQVVHAVFPNPADDYIEPGIDLHDFVVIHKLTTYFIRIRGDSMSGACISSGDVIVVDRAITVSHNTIVVVQVGEHLLLKRVKIKERKTFLYSDPPGEMVLELKKSDEIFGVVAFRIHRLHQ
jgi:DNA polymerase V